MVYGPSEQSVSVPSYHTSDNFYVVFRANFMMVRD